MRGGRTQRTYRGRTRTKKEEKKSSVFYTKTGLDSEFVQTVLDQCHVFVCDKGGATVEDTYKYVQEKGFSAVEIKKDEIQSLLKRLVYDGLLEEVANPMSTTLYTCTIYKPAKITVNNLDCALTSIPCGKCPNASICSRDNPSCNPRICKEFDKMLEIEEGEDDEKEEEKDVKVSEEEEEEEEN